MLIRLNRMFMITDFLDVEMANSVSKVHLYDGNGNYILPQYRGFTISRGVQFRHLWPKFDLT